MGEKSVELLDRHIRQIDDESDGVMQRSVLLNYELKVRQSTGACPVDK
jgi:hypothetical protein